MDPQLNEQRGWSKELDQKNIVGLGEGVGYLDRMMAGSDRSQKQFLSSKPKQFGSNQNKNKNLKNHQSNPCSKKPFQNQTPTANIDTASWIADRKQKFPKVGGESAPDNKDPIPCPVLESPKKMPSASNNTQTISKRKKTLFEKLIEMDQQSTE